MRQDMINSRLALANRLDAHELTAGMYVRIHGKNLILGREEPVGPDGNIEQDDRVRLTRLRATRYGVSVKRHTGRWERTPFSGTLEEVVESIRTFMQHLIAPTDGWTRTSGVRH